jgi:hypothetical protein
MKVVGESTGWVKTEECHGYGTEQYGCGASLLLDESDLHPHKNHEDVGLLFFTCAKCRTENLAIGLPEHVKDRVFRRFSAPRVQVRLTYVN